MGRTWLNLPGIWYVNMETPTVTPEPIKPSPEGHPNPEHCKECIDYLNTTAEIKLRDHALLLSTVVTLMMLVAHIGFSFIGKSLDMPEIVWCIILAPWFGVGGGRVFDLIRGRAK